MQPVPPTDVLFSHLIQIRAALWRNSAAGRASVMIGAGLSRQAESRASAGARFPLWADLRRKLAGTLRLSPTDELDVLDVAELYRERFGPAALDDVIIELIPDAAFGPGIAHRKLLALPWADVFTTNYDTLLERAATDIFDRRYERILVPEDLPLRASPRIVKLHGTVPSHRPFVVSRSDYKDYPRRHAPFVNLVRQAAMETVLVLLGFSGDDPNFREWTDWVQEQLGEQAPRIYLCGVLNLTAEREADMRARRIIPLDFGLLFSTVDYPERDTRHAVATAWLLEVLAQGKPARPSEWAPNSNAATVTLKPAGPAAPQFTAFSERWPKHDEALNAEKLAEISTIWRNQRLEYPGWLIAPEAARWRIWHGTDRWRDPILCHSSVLPLPEQVQLFREMVWRLDVVLGSVWTPEAEKIAELLERCNPFPGILSLGSDEELPAGVDTAELAASWIELAFAVVRVAREDLNETVHATWMGRLAALLPAWPAIGPKLCAERVYWAWARLDLNEVEEKLVEWEARDRTLLGRAKIAALKGELGQKEEARELATSALQTVRSQLSGLYSRIELLSLESWLLELLEAIAENPWVARSEFRERAADLRHLTCDPQELIESLRSDLRDHTTPESKRDNEPAFDPGVREGGKDRRFHRPEELLPAFRALRLPEVAPCIWHPPRYAFLSKEAGRAAVWLRYTAPLWSASVIVRAGDAKDIAQFLDRASVTLLPAAHVEELWKMLHRLATQVLARVPDDRREAHDSPACRIGKNALEMLSRIAFRLTSQQLDAAIETLLAWLHSARAAYGCTFDDAVSALLNRIVFAVPREKLSATAVRLLAVPVFEENQAHLGVERWPDPVDSLNDRDDWPPEKPALPNGLVEQLIRHVSGNDQTARRRAILRLLFLKKRNWLSEIETRAFADAVWTRTNAGTGEPVGGDILTAVGLWMLPDAERHGVADRIRARLVLATVPDLFSPDGKSMHLDAVGRVSQKFRQLRSVFGMYYRERPLLEMKPEDARAIVRSVTEWWPRNISTLIKIRDRNKWGPVFDPDSTKVLVGNIAAAFGECILPALHDAAEDNAHIADWLKAAEEREFDTSLATIGLLVTGAIPERIAVERISRLLLANDRRQVNDGSWLAITWMRAHRRALLGAGIPKSLVDLLVQRVALRAEPALDLSCDWLALALEEFGEIISAEARFVLLQSLFVLADVTDLEHLQEQLAHGWIERGEAHRLIGVRASSARLASVLHQIAVARGCSPEPVLERWRKLASSTPVPEIQRAWRECQR